jgi:hypothetical protein
MPADDSVEPVRSPNAADSAPIVPPVAVPVQIAACLDVTIGGIASQTSTFTGHAAGPDEASLALDGNPATNAITNLGAGNWWRMDFNPFFEGYTVTTVKVINRQDVPTRERLNGAKVQLFGSTGDLPLAEETVGIDINQETFAFNVSGVHAVKIVLPSRNFLQLAEVEVNGTSGKCSVEPVRSPNADSAPIVPPVAVPVQIAACLDVTIGGIASQTSTFTGHAAGPDEAFMAIDGNPATNAITNAGAGNWWRMDFNPFFEGYTVTTVNVINRQDVPTRERLNGAKVQLFGSTGDSLLAEKTVGIDINQETFAFNVSGVHAVKIVLPSRNYLQLAEVEVRGIPPPNELAKCSVECLERAHCPTNKPVCGSTGKCLKCLERADCPTDKPVCGSTGKCLSGNMAVTAQCQEHDQCSSGKCDSTTMKCKCVQHTHCPVNKPFCSSSGECLILSHGAKCEYHNQCSSGQCEFGKCACVLDEHCPTNIPVCGSRGQCLSGNLPMAAQCEETGQCSSGICDSKTRKCECVQHTDCPGNNRYCGSRGQCLIGINLAVTASCSEPGQCSSGKCESGRCKCVQGRHCPTGKPVCGSVGQCLIGNLAVTASCSESDQCSSGKCESGRCKCVHGRHCPTSQPVCGSRGQCLSGNLAVTAQCKENNQCSSGKCESGECQCVENRHCPGNKPVCQMSGDCVTGRNELIVGRWKLAEMDGAHFGIGSSHPRVSQPMVFRWDGTVHPSPSGDGYNAWKHAATFGGGPIFGELMVEIGHWRITAMDSNHLSVGNKNGNVSRIYGSNTALFGNVAGWNGWLRNRGRAKCAFLSSNGFLQLGDWRIGEKIAAGVSHLSVAHKKDNKVAQIYKDDGSTHGSVAGWGTWDLPMGTVLAGSSHSC